MPDSPPEPAAPRLTLMHRAARRLRLRAPAEEAGPEGLRDLADRLAGQAHVRRVLLRPNTRSLIVETEADRAGDVLAAIEAAGLARIVPAPKHPPVQQTVQLGMARADLGLQARTEGALDLRTAMALALLAGAVLQLSRGKIAGPATTLAMAALPLLYPAPRGK